MKRFAAFEGGGILLALDSAPLVVDFRAQSGVVYGGAKAGKMFCTSGMSFTPHAGGFVAAVALWRRRLRQDAGCIPLRRMAQKP